MTTYLANSGVAKIGANTIAELTRSQITETGGVADDTALGDTARTYKADNLPTWTASVNGHWYPGDTNGQALIVVGASLSLEFGLAGTANGLAKMSGTGIVTQVQHGETQNGQIIPFSAQFQGSGALTRATYSA